MAAGYRKAVEWIALNDEPTEIQVDSILQASGLTIALVADLFDKTDRDVARAVWLYRWKRSGRKAIGSILTE